MKKVENSYLIVKFESLALRVIHKRDKFPLKLKGKGLLYKNQKKVYTIRRERVRGCEATSMTQSDLTPILKVRKVFHSLNWDVVLKQEFLR